MILMPMFAPGYLQWVFWLGFVVGCVLCAFFFFLFFLTLHRMLVVVFVSSLALNPAKSIHDCSGTWQFEYFNRLASISPMEISFGI